MKIESSLKHMYLNLTSKPISEQDLANWSSNIISGKLNLEDVKQAIKKTLDYEHRQYDVFRDIYYDKVGFDNYNVDFSRFSELFLQNPFDADGITAFIMSLDSFRNKYIPMIQNAFAYLERSNECTEEAINGYLLKILSSNVGYFDDMLVEDIQSNAHLQLIKSFTVTNELDHNVESQQVDKPLVLLNEAFVNEFEQVFNRPMHVQEYFKYVVNQDVIIPECNLKSHMESLKAGHISVYNKTKWIHQNYLNQDLTEWKFIDKLLMKINNVDDFVKNCISDIVHSETYKQCMHKAISGWYYDAFDKKLSSIDLEYVFQKAKAAQYHTRDEELFYLIKVFHQETESYIEEIFKIFNHVLERQPDASDIEMHIIRYRNALSLTGLDMVSNALANSLMHKLEFHDVIKSKIKVEADNLTSSVITNKKVYEILQLVLDTIDKNTKPDILFTETIPSIVKMALFV